MGDEMDVKSKVRWLLQEIEKREKAGASVDKCSICGELFDYYDDYYGSKEKPVCLRCLIKLAFKDILREDEEDDESS